MKKIKTKLIVGIILFGMILVFNNCQKEEVSLVDTTIVNLNKIKKMYAVQFNKAAFSRIKNEPLWEKANVHYSENGQYIEIPYRKVKQKDLEKSTSMSVDHLVATINADKEVTLHIVHYFAQDIKSTMPNFELLSYYNTDNFHGFITKYDLNKNVIAVDRFINGIHSKEQYTVKDKKKVDLLRKVDEECNITSETTVTENCMFWYNPDTLDDVEIITCTYEYTITYYSSCNGFSGGHTSGGVTIISINEYIEILNNLTGKAKCVFEKLLNTSTGFKNAIKKFDGEFPVSHLELKNSSLLPNNVNAKTSPPSNYVITIEINENNLVRPNLSIARTFIHEIIHAEMFRKILSILDNGGDLQGLTRSAWIQKLSTGDYPGIYDYYRRFGSGGMQHEQMADHYRTTIIDFLKEFQSGLSQNTYEALAWEGLKGTSTWDSLSASEKTNINNTYTTFSSQGSENCN